MSDLPQFNLEADLPTDFEFDALVSPETDPVAVAPESNAQPADQAVAQPVVVIQYRNRGIPPFLMFPIALFLSLGMFTAYHYLFIRPKNNELRMAAMRAASVAGSSGDLAGKTGTQDDAILQASTPNPIGVLPLPLTLESQPLPPGFQLPPPNIKDASPVTPAVEVKPPVAVVLKPESAKDESANPAGGALPEAVVDQPATSLVAEPAKPSSPPLAIGFARPSDQPDGAAANAPTENAAPGAELARGPEPTTPAEAADTVDVVQDPPQPSREEMIQALQDEASAKGEQQDELLRRKGEARGRVEAEAQVRVESERVAFRRTLHEIVTAGGEDAGRQIDQLCNQFGRNYSDEIRNQVTGYLSRVHGKISRESEVRFLRTLGVPEAGILDFLANGVNMSINSRNGPRSPDEVRVVAAKQLLRSKLTTSSADAARASAARSQRMPRSSPSPAYRGSSSGPGR